MKPITTKRMVMPGGDLDGDWQIVALGDQGVWDWTALWGKPELTWFWDRVKAGSVCAVQGRTPGDHPDRFTLYAKLASNALTGRRAA